MRVHLDIYILQQETKVKKVRGVNICLIQIQLV